jgi:hypothetical protein
VARHFDAKFETPHVDSDSVKIEVEDLWRNILCEQECCRKISNLSRAEGYKSNLEHFAAEKKSEEQAASRNLTAKLKTEVGARWWSNRTSERLKWKNDQIDKFHAPSILYFRWDRNYLLHLADPMKGQHRTFLFGRAWQFSGRQNSNRSTSMLERLRSFAAARLQMIRCRQRTTC